LICNGTNRGKGGDTIKIKPITLAEANEFIKAHHRHHGKVQGYKFALGLIDGEGELRGAVVCGRPVARMLDDGYTAEVTRLCTDGIRNGCSFLYSAAARTAKAMGYTAIITYILESENGASLCASGWEYVGLRGGGSWNRNGRPRRDENPTCRKKLYRKEL
jgi:hypothetical protein